MLALLRVVAGTREKNLEINREGRQHTRRIKSSLVDADERREQADKLLVA